MGIINLDPDAADDDEVFDADDLGYAEEDPTPPPPAPTRRPRSAPAPAPAAGDTGSQPVIQLTQEQLNQLIAGQVAQQATPAVRQPRPAWLTALLVCLGIGTAVLIAGLVDGLVIGWWAGGSVVWAMIAQLPFIAITIAVVLAVFFWAKAREEAQREE